MNLAVNLLLILLFVVGVLLIYRWVFRDRAAAGLSVTFSKLFKAEVWHRGQSRPKNNIKSMHKLEAKANDTPSVQSSSDSDSESNINLRATVSRPLSDNSLFHLDPLTAIDLKHAANYRSFDSELPPVSQAWVGREHELADLIPKGGGVVAITGIGGQGKSALAAEALRAWRLANPEGYWEWRNCREKGDRFPSQLASMILRVSQGRLHPKNVEQSDGLLSKFFFRLIHGHTGVIVLDNVDHYVDTENGVLTASVGDFVETSLLQRSGFIIIITCRPRLGHPDSRFREIPLGGLGEDDAIVLFRKLGVNSVVSDRQILSLHSRTNGHAFWLTLLASEFRRKPNQVTALLKKIESGDADARSLHAMLHPVWTNLNERERLILHVFCEIGRAVSEQHLYRFVSAGMGSPNQFSRALRALMTLGLVIKKSSGTGSEKYETHPVVNEYIVSTFVSQERKTYSQLVANGTREFNEKLCASRTYLAIEEELVELAIVNVEASIRLDDWNLAARSLASISGHCRERGLTLELVRICDHVANRIDWTSAKSEVSPLHDFALSAIETYAAAGQVDQVRKLASNYEPFLRAATTHKILWYDRLCRAEWMCGQYQAAIKYGERGVELKRAGLDTSADSAYTLALAYRDSGYPARALPAFLRGASVDDLVNENYLATQRSHADFGNVGRCLFFSGDIERALRCLAISWRLIEKSDNSSLENENRGYAALWLSEAYLSRKQCDIAADFVVVAIDCWRRRFPTLLTKIDNLMAVNPQLVVPSDRSAASALSACEGVVSGLLREFGK